MRLAVFDIDGTLVTGPSTEKRFALHLARNGRIGPRQAFAFLAFLLRELRHYGRHVLKKDKAYLAGLREQDVCELASGWANIALERAWFEPCLARLRRHQEAGDLVVLLSGTPQFIATAIGDGTRRGSGDRQRLRIPGGPVPRFPARESSVRRPQGRHRAGAGALLWSGCGRHHRLRRLDPRSAVVHVGRDRPSPCVPTRRSPRSRTGRDGRRSGRRDAGCCPGSRRAGPRAAPTSRIGAEGGCRPASRLTGR